LLIVLLNCFSEFLPDSGERVAIEFVFSLAGLAVEVDMVKSPFVLLFGFYRFSV